MAFGKNPHFPLAEQVPAGDLRVFIYMLKIPCIQQVFLIINERSHDI